LRLKELLEQRDIEAALAALDQIGAKKRGTDIHVHAYVVRSHWRRRPKRKPKLVLVQHGKEVRHA